MAEYIEREAAVKALLKDAAFCVRHLQDGEGRGYIGASKTIGSIPTADVAPAVHGRWEVKCELHRCEYTGEYDEDYYLECSVCRRKVWDVSQDALIMGDVEKAIKEFPFCHCGARMDLGGADNA